MIANDKPKFVTLLAKIWSGIYGKDVSSVTLDIYWKTLERFTLKTIEEALYKHLCDAERGRFLPLPADLIHQITGGAQSLLAWTKILKAIQIHGTYQTVVFDDPIIHCVIHEMGGWIYLCGKEQSTLPFYQKEFEKRYQYYFSHPPQSHPKTLRGKADQYNQQCGFALSKPCFYGDKKLSQNVFETGIESSELTRRLSGLLSKPSIITSENQSPEKLSLIHKTSTSAEFFTPHPQNSIKVELNV